MQKNYPPEIAVTLRDLMRLEHQIHIAMTKHKVHSILAGQHASKLRGRGLDFAEVRHYVAGDDIRTIDWRVTARTGKTHSKVFNEEKERPAFIVVDQSAAMFFGSQHYAKSVIAAQVAAMAGFHTIKSGDRFGGIVFDEETYDHVIPKRSRLAVENFLQCIVKRNQKLPERNSVKSNRPLLKENLKRATSLITHDYVVSVVSDFSDMDDEIENLLIHLSHHNNVILVHITDPLDGKLPDGKLVLSDGGYQLVWQNEKRDAGKKYESHFHDVHDAFPKKMLRYNMPVMVLDTLTSANDQIMKILGKMLAK